MNLMKIIVAGTVSLLTVSASAFKAPSHVAVANASLAEMNSAIANGNGGALLVFHGIQLPVSNAEAYAAIVGNASYYRIGSTGPDGFPDMASGQTWMHTNNGAENKMTALESFETRLDGKPSETFRSIDYAISMVKSAALTNDAATLSFALGYLGHCVSDGFSHGWVNQQAGDYFDYMAGSGLFGPLTEEIKHIETEALLDSKLPPALVGLPETEDGVLNLDMLKSDAPYDFLDGFYSARINGEHMGGMVYEYWDIQQTILDKIGETASDMDFLSGLPNMEAGSIDAIKWAMGNNEILNGFLKYGGADLMMQYVLPALNEINPVSLYFSEVRANYRDLSHQLKSHRRNWMVMGKCTASNMVTLKIPNAPDNCAEVAASGSDINVGSDWERSANKELHRREIVAAFGLKEGGDSHSTVDNVERAAKYLLTGMVVADIPGTLVPADFAMGWVKFINFLKNNDNILVAALLAGPALALHEAICVSEGLVCQAGCTWDCVSETADCISDRTSWCWSTDRWYCWRWWGHKVCEPAEGSLCESGAIAYCAATGVANCTQCTVGCAFETLDACVIEPIKNWDNLTGLLAKDLEGISNAIGRVRDRALAVVAEKACDAAKAQNVPVEKIYRTIGLFKSLSKLSEAGEYTAVNVAFLAEDLQNDTWYNTLLSSATSDRAKSLLTSIRNGSFKEFSAISEENPVEVPDNCFDFKSATNSNFNTDPQFGLLATVKALTSQPGPTASKFLAQFGDDPTKDFPPMYNAIQGNKLVGLTRKDQLEKLYTIGGVATPTLQWSTAVSGKYSDACKTEPVSLYCDVIPSLDDPDCVKCEVKDASVVAGERNYEVITKSIDGANVSWYTRKSLVAYNQYDANNPKWHQFDYTAFPLASSPEVVEKLYKNIFMIPTTLPDFFGFEDTENPWTSSNASLSMTSSNTTQGTNALQVVGSGYMTLLSPVFRTTDLGVYSNQVSFDLWIPATQPNPYWIGQAQLYIDLPAAGLNNVYLGAINLTGMKLGDWNSLIFNLPQSVIDVLAGDYPNVQFTIALNVGATTDPYLMDNFRFIGDVITRTTTHQSGSEGVNMTIPGFFSFDNATLWNSSNVTLSNSTKLKTEGSASMLVPGSATFQSATFAASDLTGVTNKLNVDVYVPNPQPNKWWLGALQLSFNCPEAGIYNQYIGQKDLTSLFREEFNSIEFDLPSSTVVALQGSATGCSFQYSLIVNNGSGNWLFDKMGFVNP